MSGIQLTVAIIKLYKFLKNQNPEENPANG